MLARALEGTEERARDLQRTANTFDGTRLLHDDVAHVLASFAQAAEKLRLLHEKGLTAQNEALLERHFIVPSAASGVDSSLMPHLLSSRLDKEQEDEEAMLQRDAESCGSMHGHWSEERHNEARARPLFGVPAEVVDAAVASACVLPLVDLALGRRC